MCRLGHNPLPVGLQKSTGFFMLTGELLMCRLSYRFQTTMRYLVLLTLLLHRSLLSAQTPVHTEDITNFYAAFDKVLSTTDPEQQLTIIRRDYIDKGTTGLQTFIRLGGANAERWRFYMVHNRAYLQRIRYSLEHVAGQVPAIQQKLTRLKQIVPTYQEGTIYFIVGVGMVGGSPDAATHSLLLGAETLAKPGKEWAIPTAIHEFIHLQQRQGNHQLLTQTLCEGVAEFLSEHLYGKSLAANGFAPYIQWGMQHEKAVWQAFKADMFSVDQGYLGWLYGMKAIGGSEHSDLGYFVGYQICKAYFEQVADKAQAINTLISLDLSSNEAIRSFVLRSGYAAAQDQQMIASQLFGKKQLTNTPKILFGYKEHPDSIEFTYTIPADFLFRYHIPVVRMSVAGGFNDWNPNAASWQMKPAGKHTFVLRVQKGQAPANSPFKFVLNGDVWMSVPGDAANVNADGNLYLATK